jgi:hypothetical protein
MRKEGYIKSMSSRKSGYKKSEYEWYVETEYSVKNLLDTVQFSKLKGIHDPCCGKGTIPKVCESYNYNVTGSDIVDRANGKYPVKDIFSDNEAYDNFITNPPFSYSEQVIEHCLNHVKWGGKVAILATEKFLFSQKRNKLFQPDTGMKHVVILSKRPSMPPGELLEAHGEAIRGSGSIDFVWLVWQAGWTQGTDIKWAI